MAEVDIERTLRNLKIVAEIKQHDKLLTLAETFAIDPPTPLRSVWRRWYGEGRDGSLQRVHDTITAACAHVANSREIIRNDTSGGHVVRQRCARIKDALVRSRVGMTHLIDTYADDITSRVRITRIIEIVDDFLKVHEIAEGEDQEQLPLLRVATPSRGVRLPSPFDASCAS